MRSATPVLVGALMALLCLSSSVHASASSSRRHRERLLAVDSASDSASPSLQLGDAPTAWGPFNFTGTVNATQQSEAYLHFTLPTAPGSSPALPQVTPSLSGAGATLSLQSADLSSCSFVLCATRLVRPVANVAEWVLGANTTTGHSQICEAFVNTTAASSASPVEGTAPLTPGFSHFNIFVRYVGASAANGAQCSFTLTVSGDACPAGQQGTPAGECVLVSSTSASEAALTATLPASPADATLFFEVHPESVWLASMRADVSSAGDNVTVFVHEGALPSTTPGAPINPMADFSATSSPAHGNTPINYTSQAALTIPMPSYRTQNNDQRYFLGVTRSAAQQQAGGASDTPLSVSVSERVCPQRMGGPECEHRVDLFLEPFEFSNPSLAVLPTSAFTWNKAHTEIWYYAALLFLAPGQNFSVGLQAMEGQLVPPIYLRMGALPTLTQFDARSSVTDGGVSVRFLESGPTALHDGVWYVGINVPLAYPTMGEVLLFVNQLCPGTVTTTDAHGATSVSYCNGHGTCMPELHQCRCSGHYGGFDCMHVDTSMGLTGGQRALIIVLVIVGVVAMCYGLSWYFKVGMDRRRNPMAGAGHGYRLDNEGGGGGDGGGGGAGNAGFPRGGGNVQGGPRPMGRI